MYVNICINLWRNFYVSYTLKSTPRLVLALVLARINYLALTLQVDT